MTHTFPFAQDPVADDEELFYPTERPLDRARRTGRPLEPASRLRRLLARVIDNVLVTAVVTALVVTYFKATGSPDLLTTAADGSLVPTGAMVDLSTAATVLSILAHGLYNTVLVARRGHTLAKGWLGLTVLQANGARVGYGRAFLRWVLLHPVVSIPVLGGLYLLADVLVLCLDPRAQALHDKGVDTVVVRS